MTARAYVIPAWDPSFVAKVGWRHEWSSYWFVVYRRGPFGAVDVDDPEVSLTMGINDSFRKITNLGDLLIFSWGEVKWESAEGLHAIRLLRDDATFEALYGGELEPQDGIEDFLIHAWDSRALTAASEAAIGHERPAEPPTPMLRYAEVLPVATTEERIEPERRRRFLRRRGAS